MRVQFRFVAIALVAVAAGACSMIPGLGRVGGVYPGACSSLGFDPRRCAAIIERTVGDPAALGPDQAVVIYAPRSGSTVSLGSHPVAEVGIRAADGTEAVHEFRCLNVGRDDDLACSEDARIGIVAGIDHDVPCGADGTPDECATLPPTPGPAARDLGRALRVAALDVPLDHVGHYSVLVGSAVLPDGYLSVRSARLEDDRPSGFWIKGGVLVDVRSAIAGRPPIGSVYRAPYSGPEAVQVYLVFDVVDTSPGATLEVRDIVVS